MVKATEDQLKWLAKRFALFSAKNNDLNVLIRLLCLSSTWQLLMGKLNGLVGKKGHLFYQERSLQDLRDMVSKLVLGGRVDQWSSFQWTQWNIPVKIWTCGHVLVKIVKNLLRFCTPSYQAYFDCSNLNRLHWFVGSLNCRLWEFFKDRTVSETEKALLVFWGCPISFLSQAY